LSGPRSHPEIDIFCREYIPQFQKGQEDHSTDRVYLLYLFLKVFFKEVKEKRENKNLTANIYGGVRFYQHGLFQEDRSSLLNDRIDIPNVKINICSDLTLSYCKKFVHYFSCNTFDALFVRRKILKVSRARTTKKQKNKTKNLSRVRSQQQKIDIEQRIQFVRDV